jgi:GGDEF domain-containing protein
MLVQIQDQDERLNQHKADLEELVVTRTVELHELNNQLKNQAHHLEELVNVRTAELHVLNEQLKHQAYHDTLTNLPNRALFNDRLSQAILHAQRSGQALAVLFLDLDRFKNINDTLGHAVGDQLLRMVASRLRQFVRKEDTVARLGGDEFTILLPIKMMRRLLRRSS